MNTTPSLPVIAEQGAKFSQLSFSTIKCINFSLRLQKGELDQAPDERQEIILLPDRVYPAWQVIVTFEETPM